MKRLIIGFGAAVMSLPAAAQTYPSPTFNTVTLVHPLAVTSGGTGITPSTGSGSVVLSNGPAFTGIPTAPSATVGDNSSQLATTGFVFSSTRATRRISSGTSDTATSSDKNLFWSSAATSAKTQNLPGCNSSLSGWDFSIADQAKTSGTYAITITPSSGTINGSSSYIINSNGASITMTCDGVSDYVLK